LLEECESLGLAKTGSRHFRLSVLGANYEDRLFGYPEKGVLNAITPGSLRQTANELIQEVFISVKGEKNFNELRGAPGLCVQSVYPEDLNASAWAVHPWLSEKAIWNWKKYEAEIEAYFPWSGITVRRA
jgi:hypothetical protein